MKNIIKGISFWACFVFFISTVGAQDVSILDGAATDWTKTYNTGAYNEVTVTLGAGASISSKKTCGTSTSTNCASLSASNSHYLEVKVPTGSAAEIASIGVKMMGNSSGTSDYWIPVFDCKESPFNINNVNAYQEAHFIGYDQTASCNEKTFTFPSGTKSIRFYRNPKYTIGTPNIVETGTSIGSSQTTLFKSLNVYLLTGPKITNFSIAGVNADVIDQSAKTIHVKVPYAINITSQVPTFTLATGTTLVTPADATTARNFTSSVTYNVTDGNKTYTYTVTVTKELPSTACDILTFDIPNQVGTTTFLPKSTSGGTLDSILVTMPYSSSLTGLVPTYTISPLASSSTPASGVAQDFTSPVIYTVVAQDGTTTHSYGVRVKKAGASKACSILGFSLGLTDESVQIKESDTTIRVIVGSSDVISNITPIVTTTTPSATTPYIKISQVATLTSPSFPIDYTNSSTVPVKIKVMAEDNSVYKVYSVKVIRDIKPPVLSATIPLDKATDASLAGNITLTYTDNYSPTLKIVDPTKITLTGGAGTLGTVSASGLVSSIFFKGLAAQTAYTLKIGAGAFSDIYGNLTSDTTITFTTGSSVNSKLPYASHMDGASFALPAFITDPTTYDATFDTKATVTTQYGAYKLNPGDTLWINTQSIGSIYANVYALGINRYYSVGSNVNTTVTTDTITNYSVTGTSVKQKIDYTGTATTPAKVYITNSGTSSGAIYIPYVYLSAVGVDPLTEKQVWCTSK
jgi:hypothetical protein